MFNTLLKELRSQKGLTQGQLAQELGVSPGNVGDWETGKSKPGYNALASLARIFGVSADCLLELDVSSQKREIDLSHYKEEQGLSCDDSPLSEAEADIVAMFRYLPSEQRKEAFDYIYFKYKHYVEEGKESIYSTYLEDEFVQKSDPSMSSKTHLGTA